MNLHKNEQFRDIALKQNKMFDYVVICFNQGHAVSLSSEGNDNFETTLIKTKYINNFN